MRLVCLLPLCAIGVVCGTETGSRETTVNRHQRFSGTDVFVSIAGERPAANSNLNVPIFPVQGGQSLVTLPVLVVPVYTNNPDSFGANHGVPSKPSETAQTPLSSIPYLQIRDQFAQTQAKINSYPQPNSLQGTNSKSVILVSQEPIETHRRSQEPEQVVSQLDEADPERPSDLKKLRAPESSFSFQKIFVPAPVFNVYAPNGNLNLNVGVGGNRVSFNVETQEAGGSRKDPKVSVSVDSDDEKEEEVQMTEEETIPFSDGSRMFDTSEQMVQSFLRQSRAAQEHPAVMSGLHVPERLPVLKPSSVTGPMPAHHPPRPDFKQSLHLRMDMIVPSSEYTEAYDIQWHAQSNTARLVIEDGSTVIYRIPLDGGRIQFLEVRLERTHGREVRHCTLSPVLPATPADKTFPGLPAFDQFEFAGYTAVEGRSPVERWQRVVTGGPGEGGAVEGESLTLTHEMLIIRNWGQAVPLRYTVVTDSSVLGPASDSYTQRFKQLAGPTAALLPDISWICDIFHELENHDLQDHELLSRFDPIREFTGPMRDTRYDSILTKYKKQYKRKYLDSAEEAVRKNLLVKASRFIEAGNRLDSGFKMGTNFLADRLDDEINQLFGLQAPVEGRSPVERLRREVAGGPGEGESLTSEPGLLPFPYSDNDLKKMSQDLGDEFDWRTLGGVSPVHFQEARCSSCWAFAVAGSTEGALFKKTNKLVPLSPQCLVDCGKPFGTNGCNGTWPSLAYDYVQARGLPAWDEYTNYQAKVLECRDKSVPPVTHISGHVNVTAFSEAALKVAIKNHAPNVVIVDAKAKSFIYYKSGVLKDKRCGQNQPRLNHAVLAVGWGTKDGPHFIIKNTWSTKWGEEGYIRIAPDTCAVLERPSYALIEEPNIDREELRAAAASVKA